jgi:uncharacterized protein (TIGR02145 family)/prepilin-type N-terminal cleavage/methylation domain-containing protein
VTKHYKPLTHFHKQEGFTIIELLVVIVVIAILAAISIVAYTGIQTKAAETTLRSDLRNAATQLGASLVLDEVYPNPSLPNTIKASPGTSFQYTSDGSHYCLTATSSRAGVPAFNISSESGSIAEGACPGDDDGSNPGGTTISDGVLMQKVTTNNCTENRTRAVDARDDHTYWVQKMPDGKCWMLTNLAYAGGGTNTFGDVTSLSLATSGTTYTEAKYYITAGANPTTEPVAPSTSTDGGVTGTQYGYFYNWCAAMDQQSSTSACANATTPLPDISLSICPSGWRLPTGGSTGEYMTLNNIVKTNSTLNAALMIQYPGYIIGGLTNRGLNGGYWSSNQSSATNTNIAYFSPTSATANGNSSKYIGYTIRCVAN